MTEKKEITDNLNLHFNTVDKKEATWLIAQLKECISAVL